MKDPENSLSFRYETGVVEILLIWNLAEIRSTRCPILH